MKSAFQDKILDSQNSIDSIGSIDCVDSIDSIESEDSTDSIDSIDFLDSIDSILVPNKRPPTFAPHTKGKTTTPMGAAPSAPPPLVVSFSLCVWCECWRSFVWHEYKNYRIYKSLESMESVKSSNSKKFISVHNL